MVHQYHVTIDLEFLLPYVTDGGSLVLREIVTKIKVLPRLIIVVSGAPSIILCCDRGRDPRQVTHLKSLDGLDLDRVMDIPDIVRGHRF